MGLSLPPQVPLTVALQALPALGNIPGDSVINERRGPAFRSGVDPPWAQLTSESGHLQPQTYLSTGSGFTGDMCGSRISRQSPRISMSYWRWLPVQTAEGREGTRAV